MRGKGSFDDQFAHNNWKQKGLVQKKVPKNSHKKETESTAELQIAIIRFFKTDKRSGRMFVMTTVSVYCGRTIWINDNLVTLRSCTN